MVKNQSKPRIVGFSLTVKPILGQTGHREHSQKPEISTQTLLDNSLLPNSANSRRKPFSAVGAEVRNPRLASFRAGC
ncbi:hypothetical protein Thiosp_04817 [Thiorhodovibrio litoralis]|nr:hypothetical protein Thiosp_04817 [Thiorhodovibrio litoralis]